MSMIPQSNDDSCCLFAISLVYAIISNDGIDGRLLEAFSLVKVKEKLLLIYKYTVFLNSKNITV